MTRQRLDLVLLDQQLAESRSKAQALIMAGQVRVNGQVELKASAAIAADAKIELIAGPRYVSRGGEKLEAALNSFPINVKGCVCADVGSSTGGFSDCLLQNGAARVYSIDVGKGLLHWKLRNDARIVVMEETNARHVQKLPEQVQLVTVDASFISLKILLPVITKWYLPMDEISIEEKKFHMQADLVTLIKPQFEAGRKETARNRGVIRDPAVHTSVLMDVLTFAQQAKFSVKGLIRSPLLGPKGNVEFLAWLQPVPGEEINLSELVSKVVSDRSP